MQGGFDMELEKLVYNNRLFECYNSCLSKEQSEVLRLNLQQGWQLSEIAEMKKTTRQAVSKIAVNGIHKLENMENNLQFLKKQDTLKKELENALTLLSQNKIPELAKALENLKKEL